MKNGEAFKDGGVVLLHIEFVAFVVTDSAEMASQHSRSDEHSFVRKGRDISLNGRVEIELTLFHKLHQSDGGEGFETLPMRNLVLGHAGTRCSRSA